MKRQNNGISVSYIKTHLIVLAINFIQAAAEGTFRLLIWYQSYGGIKSIDQHPC